MQNERMRRIAALLKRIAKDKTYIGRVSKGFDFLGFHCCPTGMAVSEALLLRRDQKIARLYEQGASKERVGAYLRRWLGWAGVGLLIMVIGCGPPMLGVRWGIESNTQYHFLLLCNSSVVPGCGEMAIVLGNHRIPAVVYDANYVTTHARIDTAIGMSYKECKRQVDLNWRVPYGIPFEYCSCNDRSVHACSGVMLTGIMSRGVHINCGDNPSCLVINRKEGMLDIYYRRSGDEYKKILDQVVSRENIKPDEKMDVRGK